MFLEISQNLQENICATVFFSIKLQDCCNFIKKETLAQVLLCEFGEISKHTFFTEYLRMADSKVFTTYPLGDLVNSVSTVFRNGLVFGLCLKIFLFVPGWNIFVWIRIIYIISVWIMTDESLKKCLSTQPRALLHMPVTYPEKLYMITPSRFLWILCKLINQYTGFYYFLRWSLHLGYVRDFVLCTWIHNVSQNCISFAYFRTWFYFYSWSNRSVMSRW